MAIIPFPPDLPKRSVSCVAEILPFRREWTSLLTPCEVERRHPGLTRRMLAQRRAEERPPNYRTVGGCIMYRFWDIERFAAQTVPGEPATIKGGKIPRCAIYVRSQSLHASDGTSDHIGHCDTFLRQQGWQHFATTVDFGQSNRPWRPLGGFREVLEGALRRDFDVLLVPSAAHISENRLGFRHFVHTLAGFGVEVRMPDAAAANSNLQTKE